MKDVRALTRIFWHLQNRILFLSLPMIWACTVCAATEKFNHGWYAILIRHLFSHKIHMTRQS